MADVLDVLAIAVVFALDQGADGMSKFEYDELFDYQAANELLCLNGHGPARVDDECWVEYESGAGLYLLKKKVSGIIHTIGTIAWNGYDSSALTSGWIPATGTWSYSTADAPSYVISINADITGIISVGMKLRLTQTTVKYFFVTAIGAYSGGVTLITVYGGTDYALANAAITLPYFSSADSPFGFPKSEAKWTHSIIDTTWRQQSSPTAETWYNMGSVQITFPIGCWRNPSYFASAYLACGATPGWCDMYTTLSASNNSESDASMTAGVAIQIDTAGAAHLQNLQRTRYLPLSLTSKTTYYLNAKTRQASTSAIAWTNSSITMTISAVCAYL